MGWVRNIFAGPGPIDDFWYQPVPSRSQSGVSVTADAALRIATVFDCTRVIAEDVGKLPWHVFQRQPDGGKRRAEEHPLYDLVHDQPNDWQTALEFREMLTGHAVLRGHGYAEILSGRRGFADRLEPLHPDRVREERLANGRRRYRVRRDDGSEDLLVWEQVFHLRGPLGGLSVIEAARDTFGLAIAAESAGNQVFRNGLATSGVLSTANKLSDKARQSLRAWLKERQQGIINTGNPLLLEEGLTWTQVGLSFEDMQYIESRQFSAVEITRWFRMPPHKVGILDRATFSNIEHQAIEYVTDTLLPWLVRWEQAIKRDLILDPRRYFVEANIAGLLRGDIKSRYEAYAIGIQHGWLSQNDVRSLENLNPIAGGDVYLRPLNLAPVGDGAAAKLAEALAAYVQHGETLEPAANGHHLGAFHAR